MTSTNPFNVLPLEVNQNIASWVEGDNALCNFRSTCRSTFNAIDADNFSFWRKRFLLSFEQTGWSQRENVKYKIAYQRRRRALTKGATFQSGSTERELKCLVVLRDLILESFSNKPKQDGFGHESLNLSHFRRFLTSNDILRTIFKPVPVNRRECSSLGPSQLVLTLQVLSAPMLLSFEPHTLYEHFSFPDSQKAVYSSASVSPIFTGAYGLDVSMEYLLHNLNFWRYHMVREVEHTLYHPFDQLADEQRPRWWSSQPKQGLQSLGKHWKGSYAFLERRDIEAIRNSTYNNTYFQDIFAGEDEAFAFQDMMFELANDNHTFEWPPIFEQHLRSLTPPTRHAKTRAQKRSCAPEEIASLRPVSFRFEGQGEDTMEEFLATGWLSPLPPQQGIPGWLRMTMMKYFTDDNTGAMDMDALWAYEGVVLPGGQIILGRWWSPNNGPQGEAYSGPFILWCVDGPSSTQI